MNAPDFIQIPAPVLAAEIPASHKVLFGYVYWKTYQSEKPCDLTNAEFAELAKLDIGTVKNALTELKKQGFISVTFDGDPRSRNTKRTINALVSYQKHVSHKNDTPKQGYVSHKNDTRVTNKWHTNIKEEIGINKKKKSVGVENMGRTQTNVRGMISPHKERIREALRNGGLSQLKLGG